MENDFPHLVDYRDGKMVAVILKDIPLGDEGLNTTIPAGFVSDGMSAPSWSRWFLGDAFDEQTLFCSVVHDWLYSSQVITRREADKWYRDALKKRGYGAGRSWACYLALRLFGWTHW